MSRCHCCTVGEKLHPTINERLRNYDGTIRRYFRRGLPAERAAAGIASGFLFSNHPR